MKYQFKENDYVYTGDVNITNQLKKLAEDNGYKVFKGNNEYAYSNYNYYRTLIYDTVNGFIRTCGDITSDTSYNRISIDDFKALVTGKLPKYWIIDCSEKGSEKVVEYINNKYRTSWTTSNNYVYFEVDGNSMCNGTNKWCDINSFKNDPFLLPVEYVLDAIEKSKSLKEPINKEPINKESINDESINMQTITREQLKQIYDIACATWKTKLLDKASKNPLSNNINFTDEEVIEMFDAATTNQLMLLNKLFSRPETKAIIYKGFDCVDIISSNVILGIKDGLNTIVYAKLDNKLIGSIVKEEKGYILRLAGGSGSTGHYSTILNCIKASAQFGYKFFIL